MSTAPGFRYGRALGTEMVVGVADVEGLDLAWEAVAREVEACDRACSRFREDSELVRLNRSAGSAIEVSDWLFQALEIAVEVADLSDGIVDPTVGQTLIDLGYDKTFEELPEVGPLRPVAHHTPAWESIGLDPRSRRARLPRGVVVDLGASAKALCADLAAQAAASSAGVGVLVSLGGDMRMVGPPPSEGWVIRVTDRCEDDPLTAPGQTVAMGTGALATSGTSVRRWKRGGQDLHHLIDPRTGLPATSPWKTISVAAPTCVQANTASTASMILGDEAIGFLGERRCDARLVAAGGGVIAVGEWPDEDRSAVGTPA